MITNHPLVLMALSKKMNNRNKICFFNRGSVHYRKNIWMLMDRELPCDFYFGDDRRDNIKPIDTSLLHNFKGYFHNLYFGPFNWQRGALKLLRGDYTDIITQGEVYNLTMWVMLPLSKLFHNSSAGVFRPTSSILSITLSIMTSNCQYVKPSNPAISIKSILATTIRILFSLDG